MIKLQHVTVFNKRKANEIHVVTPLWVAGDRHCQRYSDHLDVARRRF